MAGKFSRAAMVSMVLATSLTGGPGRAASHEEDFNAERVQLRVFDRVEAHDCPGAVAALNDGIASRYAAVFLLAGSMYETGACVKPDWQKAVHYYSLAYGAASEVAAYRLAAGFASPMGGTDAAAALWWLRKAKRDLAPAYCAVSAANAQDSDRFVAELSTWPAKRLSTCNYIAGVLATIAGEVRYPTKALHENLVGTVLMRFTPAVPSVTVETVETGEAVKSGLYDVRDVEVRGGRRLTRTFETHIKSLGDRAFLRYPQPSGIPPTLYHDVKMVFAMGTAPIYFLR